MKTTKLLTISFFVLSIAHTKVSGQCSFITVNGSTQDPKTVCAPVDFTMEAHYEFMLPVDTTLVQILFRWNDGTAATTIVPGNWNLSGDSIWASASHIYPPTDECSRTAEAILIYDGEQCINSGYQSQTFSTWGTDEENSGVLRIDPVVYYVCEGEDIVDVTFDDNSTFNCNINIENDRPNRYYRWVQFIYNTYVQAGDRIPDVTVRDGGGTTYSMTDGTGAFINNLNGPIIQIPIPADGPNQTSFPISAPAGGVAGDIFEITLRNWNVCNPYDNNPSDALLPADPLNGDNPPIITTARIEIIAPPPVVVTTPYEFCTGDNIILHATAGTGVVRWYKDPTLDTLLFVGNNYNPTLPPISVNPNVAGNYTFYVTSFQGICESAPSTVVLNLYQSPQTANAGFDVIICSDSVLLTGNVPSAGSGLWSTTGPAIIANPTNFQTIARNLAFGNNIFTWTITNGPCATSDNMRVISDRQPSPANAGPDVQVCDVNSLILNATVPDLSGSGIWNIVYGTGNFSNTSNPAASYSGMAHDINILTWRVASLYGACPVTIDTVNVTADFNAGTANAGIDVSLCETPNYLLNANPPQNSGSGLWNIISGTGNLSNPNNNSSTAGNLSYGINQFSWTLHSKLGICPDITDTIDIIRYQSPGIANAGIDKTFCLETRDTLNGNLPVIGTGNWSVLTNPSGIPPVFSPNNLSANAIFNIMPGNEGRYELLWQLVNGLCFSRDTVVLDFGVPVPPADAGPDTLTCGYAYQMQANSFSKGVGTWTLQSGPGAVSYNPNNHSNTAFVGFTPGAEGAYDFEWRLTSGSCPSTFDIVEITIKKAPLPPVLPDYQSCGPDSFLIHISTTDPDDIANWYATATGGSTIYMGTNYFTGLLNTSKSYFVSLFDTITKCESNRDRFDITIDQVPAPPVLLGDTICGSGQAVYHGMVTPPANNVIWYNDNGILNPIDTAFMFISDTISVTTSIYARSYNSITGCISDPSMVSAIVWPAELAPVTYSDSGCGASYFNLHSERSNPSNVLFWYDVDGNFINIGDTLHTAILDSSTLYFVAEYNPITHCQSPQSELAVIIHQLPPAPQIADISNCGASSIVLRPQQNPQITDFRWYNAPVNGSLIEIADSFLTPFLSAGTSYWVSGFNAATGCEGPREEVKIRINPSPGFIDILGPTVVLKDQSNVVFFTINGRSGSDFVWNIPSEINFESDMNDFVRLGFPNTGSYNISVYEITVDGCIGTPTYHNITVIEDSMAVDIGDNNQGACTAEPFEIRPWLFGGTPPYTYSWTGDIAYLSSTNTLFTTFDPPGTGDYYLYLEVVDINLKIVRDSVHITVFESPYTEIQNSDTIACVDEEYQLNTYNSGYGPFSYLWSGPIHNLSNYTISNPVYLPHQSGSYELFYSITDINGCKAYDSITLVSDKPVAEFNILTSPGCSPLEVEFENNSTGANSYLWQFGDGTSTSQISPTHLFTNTSPEIKYMEVNLTAYSPLGCTDNKTDYVMVWPNPSADITALPQNSCNPAHIMLVSTPGNSLYSWNFGDGNSDTVTSRFNIYHSFINNGFTDTVFTTSVVTQSSLDCFDTASIDITVYATPVADFEVTPDEQTFPVNIFEIENKTDGNWQYAWDFGNGTGSTAKSPGSIEYGEAGVYTIILKVSGSHCSDSSDATVKLHPALPVANFKGADDGCMPHTITLLNESSYADSYLWEFGDGSISTAKDPTYTYYEPGIYKIKLTASGMGGISTFSDTTRVYILPNSFFDLAPRFVYVNDEAVHYFNLSDNADVFEWDFGDGTTSDEFNPSHVYKDAGTYDVTLKVWTVNGCFDLYVMENAVFTEPSGMVEFPNAFRPDSPLEENKVFKPGIIDHVDDYHMMIFNRWGELIFESFDQEVGWDGYYQGKLAKQDVYIWKVKGTYSDGKGFVKTGNVTLLY
jgi:gliding motility-associated-like protein